MQFREQERLLEGRGCFHDGVGGKEIGHCLVVTGIDLVGRHQQQVVIHARTIRAGCLQERVDVGQGRCEDVPSAVDIEGDPADPARPLVDELALGGRCGGSYPFDKVGGIEVASVANEHAHTFDIGEEALTGCWLSRRLRRQGGGQAGQNAKCADPPSDESSKPGRHGLTVRK